jgi:hypothetical protein
MVLDGIMMVLGWCYDGVGWFYDGVVMVLWKYLRQAVGADKSCEECTYNSQHAIKPVCVCVCVCVCMCVCMCVCVCICVHVCVDITSTKDTSSRRTCTHIRTISLPHTHPDTHTSMCLRRLTGLEHRTAGRIRQAHGRISPSWLESPLQHPRHRAEHSRMRSEPQCYMLCGVMWVYVWCCVLLRSIYVLRSNLS